MTGNELIVDYLTSVPAWYLATVEDTLEGAQPHVRPFSFAALQDGEIQFCTATTKDCYREMQAIPRVELTAWKPGRGWIILRGRANLEDRANATVRVLYLIRIRFRERPVLFLILHLIIISII